MKLREHENYLETEGLTDVGQFQIKVTGKAFRMLSDGIYSDKPLAIVRELSCNARDAHVEAGKSDVPFEVHLPNQLEPILRVRDFGTGLSHDKVMGLYTTYFDSTKGDSNEAIGTFGLGSKSPFSYTSRFTVRSRYQGVVRTYIAFIGKDDVPNVTCLNEEDTEEPDGIDVEMDVAREDFSAFGEAARDALKRFDPLPVIKGSDIKIEPVTYCLKGSGWAVRGTTDDSGNPVMHRSRHTRFPDSMKAIQGGVAYPVNGRSILDALVKAENKDVAPDKDIDPHQRDKAERKYRDFLRLIELPIDTYHEIGELDVAVSREHLSYDEETARNIIARLKVVTEEIAKLLYDKLQECETYWDACCLLNSWQSFGHPLAEFYQIASRGMNSQDASKYFRWRGQTLQSHLRITTEMLKDQPELVDKERRFRVFDDHYIDGRARTWRREIERDHAQPVNQTGSPNYRYYWEFPARRGVILMWDNMGTGSHRRINYWRESNNVKEKVFLIKHVNWRVLRRIKKAAPGLSIQRVTDLPEVPKNTKQNITQVRMFKFTGLLMPRQGDDWEPMSSYDSTPGYYVRIRRWRPVDYRGIEIGGHINRILTIANELGIMSVDMQNVRGVYPKYAQDAEAAGYVELTKTLFDKCREYIIQHKMDDKLAEIDELREFENRYYHNSVLRQIPKVVPSKSHPLKRWYNNIQARIKDGKNQREKLRRIEELRRELRMGTEAVRKRKNQYVKEWHAWLDKYPLLAIMDDYGSYAVRDNERHVQQYIRQVDRMEELNMNFDIDTQLSLLYGEQGGN